MKWFLQQTRADELYCFHQYRANEQKGLAFIFLTSVMQISLSGSFTPVARKKIRMLRVLKDNVQGGKTILVYRHAIL